MRIYIAEEDSGYALITEEGEILTWDEVYKDYEHAYLGLYEDNLNIKNLCRIRFGEYQILRLGDDDVTFDELKKRNEEYYKNKVFVTWLKSGDKYFPVCPCSATLIELNNTLICFECGARFNKDGTLFGVNYKE